MKIKIEKGIPMPPERGSYLVLDELEPGESISFPAEDFRIIASAYGYRTRRDGKKFRRKVEGDKVRVWRSE